MRSTPRGELYPLLLTDNDFRRAAHSAGRDPRHLCGAGVLLMDRKRQTESAMHT